MHLESLPLVAMQSEQYPRGSDEGGVSAHAPDQSVPSALIAFSSRRPDDAEAQAGYAEANRQQRFFIHKPSGKTKRVPVTLTTLALDTIFHSAPGDTLKVAMYGLSTRVPEYGALLDAARRGVRVLILLDRIVGRQTAASFDLIARYLKLPIFVRTVGRTMHQKYVVHLESATVLTGTANMSTDASSRHSEHRMLVRGDRALTAQFCADFDAIWDRLPAEVKEPAPEDNSGEIEGRGG